MKKLFLWVVAMVLITAASFAQEREIRYKVKYTNTAEDTNPDTLFVSGANGELHHTKFTDLLTKVENNLDIPNVAIDVVDASVEWITGLTFDVRADNFPLNGLWYSATQANVILDAADPTLDRIDLFTANIAGTVGKITGTASANPVEPNYDASVDYPIRFILVQAGVTTIGGYSIELMFDENVGESTEWTFIPTGTAAALTNAAHNGTISVETTDSSPAIFQNDVSYNTNSISLLQFWIKLKSDYAKSNIDIHFKDGGTNATLGSISFKDNRNGFDSGITTWQKISIDIESSGLPIGEIDLIEIDLFRSGFSGYYIDEVSLQHNNLAIDLPELGNHVTNTSQIINDGDDGINPFISGTTGLEALDEGNGIGWRLVNRDPLNYGNVGSGAIDFSESDAASSTMGATGQTSFNIGLNNIVSGWSAYAHGSDNTASNTFSWIHGGSNTSSGYGSTTWGYGNQATDTYTWCIGQDNISSYYGAFTHGTNNSATHTNTFATGDNNDNGSPMGSTLGIALQADGAPGLVVVGTANVLLSLPNTPNIGTHPAFIVGNGTHTSPGGAPWEPIVRSDAFIILKNGTITAPSFTDALITTAGDPALITKKYGDANYLDGTHEGYSETGTRAGSNLIVELGDHDNTGVGHLLTLNDAAGTLKYSNPGFSSYFEVDLNNATPYIDLYTIEAGDSSTSALYVNPNQVELSIANSTATTTAFLKMNASGDIQLTSEIGSNYTELTFPGSPTADTSYSLPVKAVGSYTIATVEDIDKSILDDTTTSYTLVLTDADNFVTLNNAGAVTLTIPANASVAFPVPTEITLINKGAGTVTVGITTDTLNQNVGGLTIAQYGRRTLTKITSTSWILGY